MSWRRGSRGDPGPAAIAEVVVTTAGARQNPACAARSASGFHRLPCATCQPPRQPARPYRRGLPHRVSISHGCPHHPYHDSDLRGLAIVKRRPPAQIPPHEPPCAVELKTRRLWTPERERWPSSSPGKKRACTSGSELCARSCSPDVRLAAT